jgi:hypothetical protein
MLFYCCFVAFIKPDPIHGKIYELVAKVHHVEADSPMYSTKLLALVEPAVDRDCCFKLTSVFCLKRNSTLGTSTV